MVRVQIWVICAGDHFFRARDRVGDLKLFEPKTMCPIIAVRDHEGR